MRYLLFVTLLLTSAHAQPSYFGSGELHASFLSDAADRSALGDTFGYGVRAGTRWDEWGVFVHVEHNQWLTSELDRTVTQGALNIAVGGEYTYFEGRARTSVAVGPSVLLFDTLIDDAGETGMFVDIRPVGLRWEVGPVNLLLDPLTFTLVAPVLGGIPLILPQYRVAFGVEY